MTVNSTAFAKAMSARWCDVLGNVVSSKLIAAWKEMAVTFNAHIDGSEINKWSLLQLPTGTGKTQGLALFCSLLPKINHPGVLIVTNLIKEADELAALINELAERPIAVSFHSENRKAVKPIVSSAPILIVTHNGYKASWSQPWKDIQYFRWSGGERKLVVIDESITVSENYLVTSDELRFLRGVITDKIASDHKQEVVAIDFALQTISEHIHDKEEVAASDLLYLGEGFPDLSFEDLSKAISRSALDFLTFPRLEKELGLVIKQSIIEKCEDTLKTLQSLMKGWSICDRSGNRHTLSGARSLLPPELKSAVILDATGPEDSLYKLPSQEVDVRNLPNNLKNYSNVTLHVSYNHQVGKTFLAQQDKDHFKTMLSEIRPQLSGRTLICLHKDAEKFFEVDNESQISLGHWFALTGLNDWRECSNVVVYGLPYLSNTVARNSLIAFLMWRGIDLDKVISNAVKYKEDYTLRLIVVMLVQAINRARCRQVIDSQGNCPETQVFIYLPKKENKTGGRTHANKILAAVKRLMPHVTIKEWQAQFDQSNTAPLLGKGPQQFISFFEMAQPGPYSAATVKEALDVSDSTMARLIKSAITPTDPVGIKFKALRLSYQSSKGPGSQRMFIKE